MSYSHFESMGEWMQVWRCMHEYGYTARRSMRMSEYISFLKAFEWSTFVLNGCCWLAFLVILVV